MKMKVPFQLDFGEDGLPILFRKVEASSPGGMDCKEIIARGADIYYLALYLAEHYESGSVMAAASESDPAFDPEVIKREVVIGNVVAQVDTDEFRINLDRTALCKEDLEDHFHMTMERVAEDFEVRMNEGLLSFKSRKLVPKRVEITWHRGENNGEYIYGYFQPALIGEK